MVSAERAGPLCLALLLACASQPARAQARYDDHEIGGHLKILVGGFQTNGSDSELRVDSRRYGLGTTLDLEDQLNVERTVTVARLDGYYRFNRAHRLEWTYFSQDRSGTRAILNEDVSIGDVVIPATYSIDTELDVAFTKVSYSWSFINTELYEFFVGAGVNSRDISMTVRGAGSVAGRSDVRTFDNGDSVPLPTLTTGMRYDVTKKLQLNFRLESFFIRLDDDNRGRWNDTYLLLEYGISKHFGFGGGVNASSTHLKAGLNDDLTAGLDLGHVGFLLYFTAKGL